MKTFHPKTWFAVLCAGAVLFSGCPAKLEPEPLEPMPRVLAFTASATEVPIGGTVTLSWRVENAASVKIEELSLGTLSGTEGNEGSVEVAITRRALFVLTARNARGAVDTAVVPVNVQGEPSGLLFTASESSVEAGAPVSLAWSAPGADTVTLTANPGGAIDLGGQLHSGAVVVNPASTTRYTLNAGGTVSTLEVQVTGRITEFSATPTLGTPGGTVRLSWATALAERVVLQAPGREPLLDTTDPVRMAAGTFDEVLPATIDPGQVFPYELKVTTGGRTLSRTVSVSIAGNPVIVSFIAPGFARRGPGEQITLRWKTIEADSVSIAANGVEVYRSANSALALEGSTTLATPAVDTTFVLTATARGGSVQETRVVDTVTTPTVTFTATPQSVPGGDQVTLSWTGQDIRALTITSSVGGLLFQRRGLLDTGSATLRVNAAQTFTLDVDNGLGDRASATAAVSVPAPITLSVTPSGTLRQGQNVSVTASRPGALIGLPHVVVQSHAGNFTDIIETGTRLVFPTSGNPIARIVSPFRTVLYGRTVGQDIVVSKNGYLTFGTYLNGNNSLKEALPTTKLEPMTVAPYWDSIPMTTGGVFWEVQANEGSSTLIVQWNRDNARVQAKISSTGQIDFEYASLTPGNSGKVGVMGPSRSQSAVPSVVPAVGTGFTFFGPMPQPVSIPVFENGLVSGVVELAPGETARASASLTGPFVAQDELVLTEVMPRSPLGANGQWLELTNWKQSAIDLNGWSLTLADAGVLPLNATIPSRGTLVLGATTDSSLNDDAGVQVALAGFDLTGANSIALTRDGTHQTLSLLQSDGGVPASGQSLTFDPGPFRYPTGVTIPQGSISCLANQFYGAQRGSPGSDRGCGFPYAKTMVPGGFFDISNTAPLSFVDENDGVASLSLAAAPVPFFGVPQTSVAASINGYLSFDEPSIVPAQYFAETVPSTTNTNSVLAVLASNLQLNKENFADSNLFFRRIGANEDPAAAAPHWIVQWHHVSAVTPTLTLRDDLSFQVKLFDDGVIEYHYAQLNSGSGTQNGSGLKSVTWLEAPGGTSALVHNVYATSPGLAPNTAIRFTPRGTP